MAEFENILNYSLDEYNYIKDLRDIIICGKNVPLILKTTNDRVNYLRATFPHRFREKDVSIEINIAFDDRMLKTISLILSQSEEDLNSYDYDLQFFYYNEIKSVLFDYRNKEKSKYTLRNYRAIYNAYPIYGRYTINGEYKIGFNSLDIIQKNEPLTEHIMCFDIEVEEIDFERARSLAHNIISEFVSYLSVILDIGFYDINSKFLNFVKNERVGYTTPMLKQERQRTSFFDDDLELVVKDNLNGLCHKKDIANNNYLNGYVTMSFWDNQEMITEKIGSTKNVEEAFSKHRMYKIKEKSDLQQSDEINKDIHFPDQTLLIPKQIRLIFRNIYAFKGSNFEKYEYFRNACRLYNKAHTLGCFEPTVEISYFVAAIETLAKTETNTEYNNFAKFCLKYNSEAQRKLIEFAYSIRSKHFHTGNFDFGEYLIDINPSANVDFLNMRNIYLDIKSQLRIVIVNWINSNLNNDDTEDNPSTI